MPMCSCFVCKSDLVAIVPCENDPPPSGPVMQYTSDRQRKAILSPRFGEARA